MSKSQDFIFVYGTLKRGGALHDELFRMGGEFMQEDVVDGLCMYRVLGGEYPAAVRGRGAIIGEVYSVSDLAILGIDELEQVPDLYVREHARTRSGLDVELWVWNDLRVGLYGKPGNMWDVEGGAVIVAGDDGWLD